VHPLRYETDVHRFAAQTRECARPHGPDAADGYPQCCADLGVARGGLRSEHSQERAVARAESLEGSLHGNAVLLGDQPFVGMRSVTGQIGQIVGTRDQPHRPADHAQALVPRRRRQPSAQTRGLPNAMEVLDEAHPGGLEDVGRIRAAEPVRACRRPYHAAELVDERVPASLIAIRRSAEQPRDIIARESAAVRRFISAFVCHRCLPWRGSACADEAFADCLLGVEPSIGRRTCPAGRHDGRQR
jgi:hypothetical protein